MKEADTLFFFRGAKLKPINQNTNHSFDKSVIKILVLQCQLCKTKATLVYKCICYLCLRTFPVNFLI